MCVVVGKLNNTLFLRWLDTNAHTHTNTHRTVDAISNENPQERVYLVCVIMATLSMIGIMEVEGIV